MKLASIYFAATFAHRPAMNYHDDGFAPMVAQRRARAHHFANQLHEIVPDVDFGDINAKIAVTTQFLAQLQEDELVTMMNKLDNFFDSILADDFIYGFDA